MTIQDIITQLQSYGLGQGSGFEFSDISNITGSQIDAALSSMFGLGNLGETGPENPLSGSMFQTISPASLQQAYGKTYRHLMESSGASFAENLITSMSNKSAKQASGGFAGSGQQKRYTQNVRDVYGKEMSGVLSEIGKARTSSLSGMSDLMSSWKDLASQVAF